MAGAKKEEVEKSREPRWTVVEMEMGWKSGREHRPVLKVEYGDCAADAMHGSIAPTRVSDQPRVRFSSFRGESRQDLNEEIQDSPQWDSTILRRERKGRESLFFLLSFFWLSLLIRPISHTKQTKPACWDLACGE